MVSITREKMIAAEKLHARAREYRGRFLNHIAVIERDIALLLTEYFCTEDVSKRQIFFDQIACRMTLDAKRKILVDIVQKDYPYYWRDNANVLKDLQGLQEFRNKLAHSILDVSEEALARPIEAGVGFVQWKEGAPIPEHEIDQWCARANMVSGVLMDIKSLLPYKQHPLSAED